MDAKTYCKKTAAFAGWIIQNIPADLTETEMDIWMGRPDDTKSFLTGFHKPELVQKLYKRIFTVAATTNLRAITGKKTRDCFPTSSPRYAYRGGDFDNWLPANQPNADACVITTLALAKEWTFVEGAATILGIGAGTGIALLGKSLIENGHTMTLVQAEEMVEKTECNEKTGMRTDGYGNFFFVETGDPENPVSVGFVDRGGRDWRARVFSLDFGGRWDAFSRLLVRNLDTSKL